MEGLFVEAGSGNGMVVRDQVGAAGCICVDAPKRGGGLFAKAGCLEGVKYSSIEGAV